MLWAHMQEQPAPLRAYPRLDPVLRKALAKDREDRYGSCGELIDAASEALGLPARARRRRLPRRGPGSPARHPRLGLFLLAGTIAAAIVVAHRG